MDWIPDVRQRQLILTQNWQKFYPTFTFFAVCNWMFVCLLPISKISRKFSRKLIYLRRTPHYLKKQKPDQAKLVLKPNINKTNVISNAGSD